MAYLELRSCLQQAMQGYAVPLDETLISKLEVYYQLLVEWNQKMNLTAITDEKGAAVKHFADSLAFYNYIHVPENASLIDIGTGAGFPGVVLKIVRPDIRLTLLDSLNKRFLFLRELLSRLGLEATFLQGRAEEFGQHPNYRETYDFAVSRAVARLNTLSEYCLPFARLSGTFVAFKGGECEEETRQARHAVQTLGGKLVKVHTFDLQPDGGSRALVEIEKNQPTPDKYPRNNGRIKAKPL